MTTDRLFPTTTAEQLKAAAAACRVAQRGDDSDWDKPEAAEARDLTEALGWSWDFSTWSEAASILEDEARLAEQTED